VSYAAWGALGLVESSVCAEIVSTFRIYTQSKRWKIKTSPDLSATIS